MLARAAGRAESLDLFGFSQGELASQRKPFIDRLFTGDSLAGHPTPDRRRLDVAVTAPDLESTLRPRIADRGASLVWGSNDSDVSFCG